MKNTMNFELDFGKLIDDNTKKQLADIRVTKNAILSVFSKDFLIDTIIEIVDSSSYISFRSERDKKINRNNIAFSIIFDTTKIENYQESVMYNHAGTVTFLQELVYSELVEEYISKLLNYLENNKELIQKLNSELIKTEMFRPGIKTTEDILDFLTFGVIFGIQVSETELETNPLAYVTYLY